MAPIHEEDMTRGFSLCTLKELLDTYFAQQNLQCSQTGPSLHTLSVGHFEALPPPSPHIAAVTLNGTARWPTGSQLIGLLRSVLRAFFAEMNWSSQFLEAENDSAPAFSSQNAIVLFQLIFGVRIHWAELMRTVGILTWRGGQP